LTAGDSISLIIKTLSAPGQGEPVEVLAAGAEGLEKNLALFEKIFRGRGEYAEQCLLLNPYVVDLSPARADACWYIRQIFFWIRNPALGYTMGVVIRDSNGVSGRDQGTGLSMSSSRNLIRRPEVSARPRFGAPARIQIWIGIIATFLTGALDPPGGCLKEGFRDKAQGKWSDSRMWTFNRRR